MFIVFVRRDLREDMKEFVKKHDADEEVKSRKRFDEMSESEKRRQSVNYRKGSKKEEEHRTNGTENGYQMHEINENGGLDKEKENPTIENDKNDNHAEKSNGIDNETYES